MEYHVVYACMYNVTAKHVLERLGLGQRGGVVNA